MSKQSAHRETGQILDLLLIVGGLELKNLTMDRGLLQRKQQSFCLILFKRAECQEMIGLLSNITP